MKTESPAGRRILVITAVDAMAWLLLRPYLDGLRRSGYEVHLACSPGQYSARLRDEGLHLHAVGIHRSFNPFSHLRPILQLATLLRSYRFDAINLHSPIAAGAGRLATLFARCPNVTYVVHGFYFHERTPHFCRQLLIGIEWILGRFTDAFIFVSEEDRQTAIRTGIVRSGAAAVTIHNGVDLFLFAPRPEAEVAAAKERLGIPPAAPVVGIVARIVKEKGLREFLSMAEAVCAVAGEPRFLVVGDSLASDRDQFGAAFKEMVRNAGLSDRFVFTGFADDVAQYLSAMNIFALPTHREGFPRSVIEAMSVGLPVVTTDIRGCREAVIHDVTGLIVPPRDAAALTSAVQRLLADPERARDMGQAGRERAVQLYDCRTAIERFVAFTREQDSGHGVANGGWGYRTTKALFDRFSAALLLVMLLPVFAGLAGLIRVLMGRPVFFRQPRTGIDSQPFTVVKFRTMICSPSGEDAVRLTPFGRLLRATSLDELPQLWNVLRGEMSLVGPRPLLPEYLPLYSARQRLRHTVKPGITGWAQVNGRNALSWQSKLELDAWYAEHCGWRLDLRILCATVWCVLSRSGVARSGHATTPLFTGCADDCEQ